MTIVYVYENYINQSLFRRCLMFIINYIYIYEIIAFHILIFFINTLVFKKCNNLNNILKNIIFKHWHTYTYIDKYYLTSTFYTMSLFFCIIYTYVYEKKKVSLYVFYIYIWLLYKRIINSFKPQFVFVLLLSWFFTYIFADVATLAHMRATERENRRWRVEDLLNKSRHKENEY